MSLDFEGTTGAECDLDVCKTFDLLPWYCAICGGRYCAKHRLPIDHKCEEAENVKTTSAGLDEVSGKDYRVDPRKPVICEVCGNEDCLLHKLVPSLAAQIEIERAEALARRVAGGIKQESSAHQPWRIGKLGGISKEGTNAAGPQQHVTPAGQLNGQTLTLVCIWDGEKSAQESDNLSTFNILIHKATFSHGVSVGFAANAIGSLVSQFEQQANNQSTLTNKKQQTPNRIQTTFYLRRKDESTTSAPFTELVSVDGGALYLLDHLKRSDSGNDNAFHFEKLMFALVTQCSTTKEKRLGVIQNATHFLMGDETASSRNEKYNFTLLVDPAENSALNHKFLRQNVAQLLSMANKATVKVSATRQENIVGEQPQGNDQPKEVIDKRGDNILPLTSSNNDFLSYYDDSEAPVFPSSSLDLPVSSPRAQPINAKDSLVAKMGPSKAIVGVQLLQLTKSSAVPTATKGDYRYHRGSAFCIAVDGKWSVGRAIEKILGSANLPLKGKWQLVLVQLFPSSIPSTSSSSGAGPPLFQVVSSDLSALIENIGVSNGALLLLVEQLSDAPTSNTVIPSSLLGMLQTSFVTIGKLTKLSPKVEAKVRKDCVVQ